ncbi:MAG: MoxR family ATPase [Candidatus Marinimicrobia bacterium]|nr:MoxR family ATPase [Candidatus Neomarinimicrobiota bacterium]
MKNDIELVKNLHEKHNQLLLEISQIIVGQTDIINQIFIAQLCQGHCLLIGVPGLAKTLMIQTLSQLLDLEFKRIQFTPDLMPSDITGTEVLEEDKTTGKRKFTFYKGPVFGNIILADEINRTPPKTQSALLEAMQEHKITANGKNYILDEPFFVLATQNPIEQEGTYPLPEAQLDRFMFSLQVDYPTFDEEIQIVKNTTSDKKHTPSLILTKEEILKYQQLIRRVPVSDNVIEYAVKLSTSTRPGKPDNPDFVHQWISWGAGPRASQYLILAAKTHAVLDGRPTPELSDVIKMAKPVLRHRIITNFSAEAENITSDKIIEKLIDTIKH